MNTPRCFYPKVREPISKIVMETLLYTMLQIQGKFFDYGIKYRHHDTVRIVLSFMRRPEFEMQIRNNRGLTPADLTQSPAMIKVSFLKISHGM